MSAIELFSGSYEIEDKMIGSNIPIYLPSSNQICKHCGDGNHYTKKMVCRCKKAYYCDKNCQKLNWRKHRTKCKKICAKLDKYKKLYPGE
jgi:hypothetical protein